MDEYLIHVSKNRYLAPPRVDAFAGGRGTSAWFASGPRESFVVTKHDACNKCGGGKKRARDDSESDSGHSSDNRDGHALNKPFRAPDGSKYDKMVYVKTPSGKVKKLGFGLRSMKNHPDDEGRKANFRARHNCDDPGPKHKARYWSCKNWE